MTKEEILHLASLSRIKMSDEEVVKFQGEIQSILEYVGMVNSIVADTELKKVPGPVQNVFRQDEVVNELGSYTESLVAAFPDKVGNYLKVQKILNPDN
jgi:aspartyl-tRNA(Asn)/glutamyl-tRNA(Gln) amidotransferase subunit C